MEAYSIEGMSCSGCERTISKFISNIKDVRTAKADLNSASVDLEYDPDQVNIDEIRQGLSKLGYKIVEQNPALRSKSEQRSNRLTMD